MTPEQENQLCRLLKLKSYEQPPPGYFNRFARQVMARIAAGEAEKRTPLVERLFREAPWVQRLLGAFEAKPLLAGGFGALACALLISGIIYSERMESAPVSLAPAQTEAPVSPAISPSRVSNPFGQAGVTPVLAFSTNPIIQSGSLFDQFKLEVEPVGFRPPGN